MITISLCMIVKNEEDTISRCLDSVKDIVDEINIVDTGSTDRTKEIVRSFTERIFDFAWIDNFSAARNFAFSKATKEYIMWLDADDVILEEDRQKFLQLKQTLDPSVDVVMMNYHTGFDEYGNVTFSFKRERLLKRARQYKWQGVVHECIELGGNIIQSDIAITHKKLKHSSSDRNLKIYERVAARGEKLSPRDLFYYANELKDHKQYKKAIQYYQKFLKTKQCWIEDEISALGSIAYCYEQLGDPEKEITYTLEAFKRDRPRAEFCCRLGYHFFQKQEYPTAIFWYKLATQLERPNSWGFFIDSCWTWLPHLQLCVCYDRIGDYEKSYEHNEIARKYRPDDPAVLHNKKYLEGRLSIDKQMPKEQNHSPS